MELSLHIQNRSSKALMMLIPVKSPSVPPETKSKTKYLMIHLPTFAMYPGNDILFILTILLAVLEAK